MRKLTLAASIAAAFLLTGASLARAAVVVLTFEGIGDQQPVGNYYNGGAGPNYGISFGPDSLALVQGSDGGSGNFSNPPSADTVLFFLSGPGDVMNVAAGFDTGFSFFYADQVGFTGSVQVFDGLDGTGNLLASLSLPSTPDPYNVFVPVGVAFNGIAESVIFSGSADFIAFDNITLGADVPVGTPAPSTLVMSAILFGMFGVVWAHKRRKQAAMAA